LWLRGWIATRVVTLHRRAKFGLGQPRIVSSNPKRWRSCPGRHFGDGTEVTGNGLRTKSPGPQRDDGQTRRGRFLFVSFWNPAAAWLSNRRKRSTCRTPFDAVLARANPRGPLAHILTGGELDDATLVSGTMPHGRTVLEKLVKMAAAVCQHAPKLRDGNLR